MYRVLVLFFLTSCMDLNTPRTIQQSKLVPSSLKTISEPIFDDDEAIDEPSESEDDYDDDGEKISSNFYKEVSITVSDSMPLRTVFTQLSRLAGVNIFVAQDVDGRISFDAKQRPVLDIMKDICDSCVLKYTIHKNSIKIENDTPLIKTYSLQFLNIQRETQSSVSISTDIFMNQSIVSNGNSSSSSNSQNDNGSNSVVSGFIKNDFWTELEQNLKTIIGEEGTVSVHKQGGLVTVCAPQYKHKEVKKYIRLLRTAAESQVLIEAKILEVNLKDEYKAGINWNIVGPRGMLHRSFTDRTGLISFGVDKTNLSIVAGLIEQFGAVKTLSSPRITVLNNQSAIMKVAQNEVIYIPELQKQYGNSNDARSSDFLTTTLHTVPIGLIMSVQPSIDTRTNSILLNLRPTISRIAGYKEVPFLYQTTNAGSTSSSGIQSQKIPIIDIREMDSVLNLRSGQVAVMGGLMSETSSNNRSGLPGFSELDIIAGQNAKSTNVTELVIFLKATILNKKSKKHHSSDQRLYNEYASDPRPLRFTSEKSNKKYK